MAGPLQFFSLSLLLYMLHFLLQNMTYRSEVQVTLNFCVMQVSFEMLSPRSRSRFAFLSPHLMEDLAYLITFAVYK